MKNPKQSAARSWTNAFREAFARARRAAGMSWEAQGLTIVDAWEAGGRPTLNSAFQTRDGDIFTRANVNAQKLRRWLDDEEPETGMACLNLVPALLAALPPDERMAVLSELLTPLGLVAQMASPPRDESVIEAFLDTSASGAEVTSSVIKALEDNMIEPFEAAAIRLHTSKMICALHELADAADRAATLTPRGP